MTAGYYGNNQFASYKWSPKPEETDKKKFFLSYAAATRPPNNFLQECSHVAQMIAKEAGSQSIRLFLSGGLDSEFMARVFLQNDIPFEPVIFRYNRSHWDDMHYANKFCSDHELKPLIVNFDEDSFLEREIYDISQKYSINEPFAAFDIKRMQMIDGYCVFGTGDIVLEYNSTSQMIHSMEISAMNLPHVFLEQTKRKSCYQFYQFTPEQMLSYLNESIISKWVELVHEINFDDVRYFKYYLYKKYFPDIVVRNKYYGYERFAGNYYNTKSRLEDSHKYDNAVLHIPLAQLLHQLDPDNKFRSETYSSIN